MQLLKRKFMFLALLVSGLLFTGCGSDVIENEVENTTVPTPEAVVENGEVTSEETAVPPPLPAPVLRPIVPAGSISDPADQMDEYMNEGLFISHFDSHDIGNWQGYSQDTETTVTSGDPPEGYISSANWHAKQTTKWVLPTDGFLLEEEAVIFGDSSGRWSDTIESTRITTTDMPNDWSDYTFLSFWVYSEEANDAGIQLAIYSELDSTTTDDYYKKEIIIDWEGWRLFEIPLHEFTATREPVGWHKIDYIKIASSGWGHTPIGSTNLIFDEMKLSNVRIGPRLSIDMDTDIPHPYLMLNEAEIDYINYKIENYDWAKTAYATLQARADRWLNETISVPETGGGFYHDDDDAAYAITERHYELVDGARDLALMYQFSGDPAYMEKAKEILLAYAESYLTYEITDKEGRTGEQASAGGRATAQGINEARWVIPLAWAYDLIYNEMSEAERTAVSDQILRPVADLLMLNNEGRHNHQTWYNSGVGVIGFVLGEKEYVWYALLKDDSSLYYQLDKSVTADGMWYEGSMHYQFYVLRAFLPLMEATHHAGFNVYENPQYKALFDFMVTYADPNLEMPTINDGRVVDLTDSDRVTYYEIAYSRLGDPRYVPILDSSNRTDLNALLYGMPELGESATPEWQTQNYDQSALAVLRSGGDEQSLQVTLNYMGYQGGHSHPDQLSFVLFGLDQPLAPDAGSIKYRITEQEAWFKQTLSHNTLVVDGASQERALAGNLTHFIQSEDVQVATVSNETLYPGVNLERTLLLNDTYLIDIYRADSEESHTYDWVYHNYGTFSYDGVDFEPANALLGETNGYEYLTDVETAVYSEDWQAAWQIPGGKQVGMYFLGEPNTNYYTANGPIAARVGDEIADSQVPMIISRREAMSTQFVSIIQPYWEAEDALQIETVPLTDDSGQPIPEETTRALQIDHAAGSDLFLFGDEPGIKQHNDFELNGYWGWVSHLDGELQWLLMRGHSASGDGWTIHQEDLGTDRTPPSLGVYVEVIESSHVFVQNYYEFVTFITLEGFMDSALVVTEYNQDGDEVRTMPIKVNENGVVKFLIHPGVTYEVVGE